MKLSLILLSLLILTGFESCTEEIQGNTIQIGTTYKIVYESDILMIGDIQYEWSFEKKPSNSYSVLLCSRDKALFTPDVPGDYEIHVFVDNEGVVNDTKEYYFSAVGTPDNNRSGTSPGTSSTEINLIADANLQSPATATVTTPPSSPKDSGAEQSDEHPVNPGLMDSLSIYYTIQAYSQSNRKTAEENRDMLISKGYPAYIQPFRIPGKDKPWYRVRVGKYTNMRTAQTFKKTLSKLLKSEDLWIDTLRTDG